MSLLPMLQGREPFQAQTTQSLCDKPCQRNRQILPLGHPFGLKAWPLQVKAKREDIFPVYKDSLPIISHLCLGAPAPALD